MADLKQKFGGLAAQLEGDASAFQVTAGSTMALVSSSSDEHCVNMKKNSCTCDAFKSIKVCVHLVAAVKQRSVAESADSRPIGATLPPIPGERSAGEKPGSSRRKGARTTKVTPKQSYANLVSGGYVIIRSSKRQKVCNGCKAKFITETALIRHFCSLPYPYRNDRTGEVETRQGKAANHYFHLNKWCVLRSEHHQGFSVHVSIDPTLTLTPELRSQIKAGDLAIIQ